MGKLKKVKTEFSFVKQNLMTQVLENNQPLFDMILDNEDAIGKKNTDILRGKFVKSVNKGESTIKYQMSRVCKLSFKLEKLHKWQKNRYKKFHDWLDRYLSQVEEREEQDFRDRYCVGIDEFCLAKSFKYENNEETYLGLENEPENDDVDDEIEEVEEEVDVELDELEQAEGQSSLLASSETEVSEEKKQEERKRNTRDKFGAFFGVDKNCGDKKDERSES
ncbi:MAG: hypothetical protein IJW64_04655 [Clostridia bacterium]|nr:hypothetical protein [Clostridia bacterium]